MLKKLLDLVSYKCITQCITLQCIKNVFLSCLNEIVQYFVDQNKLGFAKIHAKYKECFVLLPGKIRMQIIYVSLNRNYYV